MTEERTPSGAASSTDRRVLFVAGAAILLGIVLIAVFGVMLLRDRSEGEQADEPNTPSTEQVTDLDDLLSGVAPAPGVVVLGVSNAATISVTLQSPSMLDVAGERFQILAESVPTDQRWQPAIPDASAALWVYGTVVNYVIGLGDTAETRALLDSLLPGDEIALTSYDGSVNRFAFDSRSVVAADSSDVFAQSSPGVTLVLLGTEGESRLVAHGRYVVPEASSQGLENVVELGETAQLESLQVTAIGTEHLVSEPSAPAGFAYFLIDFELMNVGSSAFDLSQLRLSLADQFGNQYALNALASQFARFPLATGLLGPQQSLQASAGYQVPATLNSETLRWLVTVDQTDAQVEVRVPFSREQDNAAIVSVLSAEVSLDGTFLAVQGQITNLGAEQLVVNTEEVRLSSAGTVYFLFANNPAFPWVVAPQQTLPFTVTFQRPQEGSAVLEVLNYPFELTGLR
jgi:hypothetical protein